LSEPETSGPQAPTTRAAVPLANLLEDDLLILLLEKIAVRPWDQLEDLLRPLVIRVENMERVLALLESGALRPNPHQPSIAERGAIKAVALAAMLYNAPEGTGELAELGVRANGHEFLTSVLVALATIPEPSDRALARLLTALRLDGQALLSTAMLDQIRLLADAYPEKRELYESMLALLGEQLGDEERRAYYARFLTEIESPELLKDALIGLLGDEDQGRAVLVWAAGLFDGKEASRELQQEIAMAVALAAPPAEAAAFLGERATNRMYAQMFCLGSRPGGTDALVDEYNNLSMLDANAGIRQMLVAGMSSLGSDTLLGVARTDLDADVRGQALVTMTGFDQGATLEAIDILRRGHTEQADPNVGIPDHQILSAARNIAALARDGGGPLLQESVGVMRDIALAPGTSSYDRNRALDNLRSFLSRAQWDLLQQEAASLIASNQ
jgi:hypothetical protein